MDKEKAIAKAEAFKDDWEIDPKRRKGLHKPTGFEIYMGSIWRDENGMHYDAVLGYKKGNYPARQGTIEEMNELQRQFGILYEAGYMPGMTKEEREEESRRIHEDAEKSRKEFQARVAAEEEWQRTHPEEYIEQSENNIRKYYAKAQAANEKWYKDRGMEFPEERKKYYEQETQKMIEKFHKEYLNKDLGR